MRLLITGAAGQLGLDLIQALQGLGEIIATDRQKLDLCKADVLAVFLRSTKPDIIVNAGAYTAVDKAETEPELVHAVNAMAPGIMAEEARKLGALLVHYSTDYVFDGAKDRPYVETDVPRPLNVYGASKLAGERAVIESGCRHLVLRTSWVYSPRGRNFMLTMLRLLRERKQVNVVADQVGAPTSSRMIADETAKILRHGEIPSGLFHLTASGQTSWYGFAKLISQYVQGPVARLVPIEARDYPTAAARPANSRLDCTKLVSRFHLALPYWEHEAQGVLENLQAMR